MKSVPRRVAALMMPLFALACDGAGDPHACDAGTPTCESSLVVIVPTNSVDFTLTLDDGQGLQTTIDCPEGGTLEGYTITCGASQVTIETSSSFGEEVTVRLEQGVEESFTPNYQKGGDFCGNPCTIGTIQL